MAAPSKGWVCGRSLTEILGLNPARGMDICLVCVCLCVCVCVCVLFVVRQRFLRQADHSSRGVLPIVVRR